MVLVILFIKPSELILEHQTSITQIYIVLLYIEDAYLEMRLTAHKLLLVNSNFWSQIQISKQFG